MTPESYAQCVENVLVNEFGLRQITARAAVEKFDVEQIVAEDPSRLKTPPEQIGRAIGKLLNYLAKET